MGDNYDFFATELLAELKQENSRKDELIKRKDKHMFIERIVYLVFLLSIVSALLLYFYQYDYATYLSNSAEGVYAIVDSDGNMVATDLTGDDLAKIMGGSYGESKDNDNKSSQAQEEITHSGGQEQES